MTWLALGLLAAALAGIGTGLLRIARARPTPAWAFAAGAVGTHVVLQLQSLLGVAWSAAGVVVLGAAGGAVAWARRAPRPAGRAGAAVWGWGDGVALLAILGLGALAATAAIDNPDFVLHWGAKGRKFAAAGGIDLAFLGPPSGWHLHPDYPNLLPELFALTARLGGAWNEGPQLCWTAVACAVLLLAAREALAGCAASVRNVALAFLALSLLGAALGLELAGNADPWVALALLLAVPALADPLAPRAALRVGTAAGLAAACKIEGVVLAGFLVAAYVGARLAERPAPPRQRGAWLAALGLPAAGVVAPWVWTAARHDLFQAGNTGAPTLARFALVLPEIGATIIAPVWGGLPLTLLALPWLLATRRLRALALVCAAQLLFYLWVYGTAPVDSVRYVQWSFARLLLHVLPAVWVACALALKPAGEAPAR